MKKGRLAFLQAVLLHVLPCVPAPHSWSAALSSTYRPQQSSLQSSALSLILSPAPSMSLPAPATVLHAVRVPIENIANIIRATKRCSAERFMEISLGDVRDDTPPSSAAMRRKRP